MFLLEIYFKIFDNLHVYLKISIQILYILLLTFFISKLVNYFLFALFKYFVKSTTNIDNSLVVAVKKPVLFFIWLYSFLICSGLITDRLDGDFSKLSHNIKNIIIYLGILMFLLRSMTQIKKHYIAKKEKYGSVVDYAGLDAVDKLSKIAVFVIWLIFALGKIGVNLNGLLAFGGAGGIIVGFAGKDLFANIFGGLMIYLDKPFAVGDWIASPDRVIEGDVEYIGWRQTRILTFETYPLYVPNAVFGTIAIENKSRIRSRRIRETFNVRYTDFDKIQVISEEIAVMLKNHNNVNKKYRYFGNFTNFTEGMLTIMIYCFTNTTDFFKFQEIRQDILLKVISIIRKNGGEVAYKPNTLYMKKKDEFNEEKESTIIETEEMLF